MGTENNIFNKVFNRLLELGVQSQKELASILGVSSTSVWNAKKENRFPKKWISILCRIYNKTPEWMLGIAEPGAPCSVDIDDSSLLSSDLVRLAMKALAEEKEKNLAFESKLAQMESAIKFLQQRVTFLQQKDHEGATEEKTDDVSQDYSNQPRKEKEGFLVVNS